MIARLPRPSRLDNEPGRSPRAGLASPFLRPLLAAALALAGGSVAGDALAASNDAEANKLYDAAMNDDYLNVELGKAEAKLKDAIKKCGKSDCSPAVLAKVHLGLGVIHFANNKPDLAKESFIAGLKVDGSAALDPTFKGAEIDKIFDDAKKAAGSGAAASGGSSGSGGSTSGGGEGGGTPSKPGGDLKHTPVAEQQVNTPVPIYIEVPSDLGVNKVTLRYKPFGATNWKPLEMQKIGEGWGAEVPCSEVTTTGDLKYYITADDEAGTVATAGSRNEPYKVSIKNEIESDPPSLPGKKAPKQCASSTDCPPGFPRCVDAQCGSDDDCNSGLYCKKSEDGDGTCKRRSSEGKPWGSSCSESSECGDGLACIEGSCQEGQKDDDTKKPSGNKKLNMISLEAGLDLLLIGSREFVCSGTKDGAALAKDGSNASDGSYVCFYKDGGSRTGQFYGEPDNSATGTNGIAGGFGLAGGRIGVGYDRQLTQNLNVTLGLHLGVAFSDFPSSPNPPTGAQPGLGHSQANSFMPFWIEGRAGYNLFGGWVEPMKFKPYAYVGFGFGQVNAGVPVSICDKRSATGDRLPSNTSTNNCPAGSEYQEVNAFQITGLDYVPIGIGSTFGLWKGLGVKAELRVLFMLPTFGVVFQPQIGPVYAF